MASKQPRIGLYITDEMNQALNETTKKTRIPKSDLVRLALEKYLNEQHGYTFLDSLEWGGNRTKGKED